MVKSHDFLLEMQRCCQVHWKNLDSWDRRAQGCRAAHKGVNLMRHRGPEFSKGLRCEIRRVPKGLCRIQLKLSPPKRKSLSEPCRDKFRQPHFFVIFVHSKLTELESPEYGVFHYGAFHSAPLWWTYRICSVSFSSVMTRTQWTYTNLHMHTHPHTYTQNM